MTTRVQYPIRYVQNMHISIYKVDVNGCGRLYSRHRRLDILDGPMLEKTLEQPFDNPVHMCFFVNCKLLCNKLSTFLMIFSLIIATFERKFNLSQHIHK
jgi:hypothetical protein